MPRRGKTADRDYGAKHKAERARVKLEVDAGTATCCRCGGWIQPGTLWDLDHADDRVTYRGPAHRSCNRRAGAIKGNKQRGRNRVTVKRWVL